MAKVAAHQLCINYREAYGMWIANGILFNHESPAARGNIRHQENHAGRQAESNWACRKDYIWATWTRKETGDTPPEYVEAIWLMLQHQEPDDFVVATGESHTVREFAGEVFKCLGIGMI